jgi:hypothetical protein
VMEYSYQSLTWGVRENLTLVRKIEHLENCIEKK